MCMCDVSLVIDIVVWCGRFYGATMDATQDDFIIKGARIKKKIVNAHLRENYRVNKY